MSEPRLLKMDVVQLCEALIAIDSINPFVAVEKEAGGWDIQGNEGALLSFCEEWLQEAGWQTKRQECGGERQNLLAQKGEGPCSLLFYGHLDTVEPKEGWSREEALSPRRASRLVDGREQEVIYGLGANDMKGGIAVMLRAVGRALPRHLQLKMALGCDEEFWSLGSHCLVSHSSFLEDVMGVLVPEVGEPSSAPQRTEWMMTLGRCGRVELEVEVPGTGGHGAEPNREDRVNAIEQAARIVLALGEFSRGLEPFVHPESKVTVQRGYLVSQITGGQGTLSIPDRVLLRLSRVLVPGESAQSAFIEVESLLARLRKEGELRPVRVGGKEGWPQVSLRPRPTPALQPYCIPSTDPFVQQVQAIVSRYGSSQWGMGVSVADENRFAVEAQKPVISLGPRGENSHAAQEWVTVESLYRLERLYGEIIRALDREAGEVVGPVVGLVGGGGAGS